ncbi:nucleotidyltransferase domain-containing protein [Stygiolobus caldivivus]|uniref:DNA polymerase subunit beta n=1 Tax=Stygiolobus caldivivus TaxID=2824673 RepID=A0A8D5U5M4_9CREN|nr:nucleotidyltransferase domain-containing protein [Stygiolobus caldivivus]BCU69753.1 DNA polymerase subunit beta [Stygiolobus caldivivus]
MREEYEKVLRAIYEERKEILGNIEKYLKGVKDSVLEKDPGAKVLLFGSFVRGDFRPDSDIDVLIISDEFGDDPHKYAELVNYIRDRIKRYSLFEFHVVTRKTYEEWYKRFIDVYKEI